MPRTWHKMTLVNTVQPSAAEANSTELNALQHYAALALMNALLDEYAVPACHALPRELARPGQHQCCRHAFVNPIVFPTNPHACAACSAACLRIAKHLAVR